jgi:hypothetical protein
MNDPTPTRSDFWYFVKWGVFAIFVGGILYVVLAMTGMVGSVLTAPGRVVNKTLGTDNIIASYEWFYDVNAQYISRASQVRGHATLIVAETDPKERSRLSIEIAAMRQSCRDLVTKYNANSEKANKSLFKSRGLPETLEISTCE